MAPPKPVEFHYAARSDVGLVRQNNQDSGYAGANLLVLADGMGGPAGGDIASSVAIAHLVPLDTDSHPAETLLPSLRDALMDAHEELSERSEQDPELAGLGTTCIALMRSGNKLAMVHIGDSRAYLLRGDTLTQVTTDHSFVQYLVDSGQITPEEAEHHPQRNVVMRILGDSQADVTPDETMREAVVGDRWLLCSDGLSGVVSSDTIAEILTDVRDPGECAEELIRLALLAGGRRYRSRGHRPSQRTADRWCCREGSPRAHPWGWRGSGSRCGFGFPDQGASRRRRGRGRRSSAPTFRLAPARHQFDARNWRRYCRLVGLAVEPIPVLRHGQRRLSRHFPRDPTVHRLVESLPRR